MLDETSTEHDMLYELLDVIDRLSSVFNHDVIHPLNSADAACDFVISRGAVVRMLLSQRDGTFE